MSISILESFIKKYQTARNYNSKEIRLSLTDANELSDAIALLLADRSQLQEKIITLQDQLLANNNELNLSGGKF